MRKNTFDSKQSRFTRRRHQKRGAFTLVEILIAVAVMMLLLTIILVPVNLALDIFHIGKARSEVQQANNLVINQLAAELKQAVFVYPNEQMPGITNKAPYTSNSNKTYYQSGTPADNTSRLDFILPVKDGSGSFTVPVQASNYIVTYYARRLDTTQAFDLYSNPVVLFRSQYPIRNDDGTPLSTVTTDSSSARYNTPWPTDQPYYSGRLWLMQGVGGEPNLEKLSLYPPVVSPDVALDMTKVKSASHLQITPRDMALVAPNASDTTPNYRPDSSFIADDTNGDGKIDRVTINLNLAKYDAIGARNESQQLRLTRVVDLPNVK